MIKDIKWDEKREATVVTLLEGFKHKYEDGDQVIIKEVKGMMSNEEMKEGENSINGKQVTVKVINPSSFMINEDARQYSEYEGNGIAKQIKVPKKLTFKSLTELELLESTEQGPQGFDVNLQISDFEKLDNKVDTHYLYCALLKLSR